MKYFYSNGNSLPHIDKFTEGSHAIYVCEVKNYVFNSIRLEEQGWEIRDCMKILQEGSSKQALLLRKPFKGTVASNVIKNGCGGINIDATRIKGGGTLDNWKPSTFSNRNGSGLSKSHIAGSKDKTTEENNEKMRESQLASIQKMNQDGRFPSNLLFSHSESCERKGNYDCVADCPIHKLDLQSGNASRFFFSYKNEEELLRYLETLIKC